MDLETAKRVVAQGREADRQLAEAEEVVREERRRQRAEQRAAEDEAQRERGQAVLRYTVDCLGQCVSDLEELRAQYGIEFERLLSTPAIPYFADGHETRMELRLAVAGLAQAAEVLRRRLEEAQVES